MLISHLKTHNTILRREIFIEDFRKVELWGNIINDIDLSENDVNICIKSL